MGEVLAESYIVCVMLISCFIEEAEFACTDRSEFYCEKRWWGNDISHDFFFLFSGKQSSLFLGSRILSVKHLNSLLKVHQLNLSQTLRRIAVCYSRQQKHAEHYKTQMFSFTNKMKATLVRWPRSLELNLNPSHEGIWMWSVWATGPPVVSWPSAGFVPFTCLLSTLDDRSPKKLLWKSALLICTEHIWIKATGFVLKNGWDDFFSLWFCCVKFHRMIVIWAGFIRPNMIFHSTF